MAEAKVRGAIRFAQDVMAVLRAALSLRDQKAKLEPEAFAAQAAEIEQRLDALIDKKRRLTDPDNVRLAKRLRKQRAHLLRCLYVQGLDATNNQAERCSVLPSSRARPRVVIGPKGAPRRIGNSLNWRGDINVPYEEGLCDENKTCVMVS
jgi:hypothetical protein